MCSITGQFYLLTTGKAGRFLPEGIRALHLRGEDSEGRYDRELK
jgi:hypothetical protein